MAVAAEEVQTESSSSCLTSSATPRARVLHAVDRARRSNTKTAVVISGGPGSGKCVIALSLMGELSRQGRSVMHATGSRSFTQTLRKVAGKRAPASAKLFTYFNSFMTAEPNDLDCLILDEAHRLRETSVSRYTRKELRSAGRPQIHELLSAARVPVFLLDEHQVVRPGEMGTVEDIEATRPLWARGRAHQPQRPVPLWWIGDLRRLGAAAARAARRWTAEVGGRRRVHRVAWPTLRRSWSTWLLGRQGDGYAARMAAGYCWPWSDPTRRWALGSGRGRSTGGRTHGTCVATARSAARRPPRSWASDPAGFGQVGCVYTAQGFEYDHAGVIIGPGLRLARGRVAHGA